VRWVGWVPCERLAYELAVVGHLVLSGDPKMRMHLLPGVSRFKDEADGVIEVLSVEVVGEEVVFNEQVELLGHRHLVPPAMQSACVSVTFMRPSDNFQRGERT